MPFVDHIRTWSRAHLHHLTAWAGPGAGCGGLDKVFCERFIASLAHHINKALHRVGSNPDSRKQWLRRRPK